MRGTVLVTGATGTVGRHVVAGLVAAGAPVRAAMTDPGSPGPPELEGCERVRFDMFDQDTWTPALHGVDRVFLMRPPAVSDTHTVIGPLVERFTADRIRQVVFLSVVGVNPLLPHWRTERDLRRARVPATLLRAAFFMQNLETAYRAEVRDHDRIRLPAGRGRTAFVDTRDVAALAVAALLDPDGMGNRSYTCTGGEALDWYEVASLLSASLGRGVVYQPTRLLDYRRELLATGLHADFVSVQVVIQLVARLGLAAAVSDDMPAALGRPATGLSRYLDDARAVWSRP